MKVLVTGSEGYIGSVLVPYLQSFGHEVVGIDACYVADRQFLEEQKPYTLVKSDIRDVKAQELEGFDAICHLAALSNDPAGEINPNVTADINFSGTLSLAKAAKKARIQRFLLSGSCSIYGASDTSELLSEDARFNPVTAYAKSKVDAERGLSKLAEENFSPVYLRNATAYGASPKLRLDLVVNNLVASAYALGKIAMTSDGTPWRPLAHVKDICLAFKCALEAPKSVIHNQAFNIGRTDANYQIKDVAGLISTVITNAEISFANPAESNIDKRTYKVNFHKALNLLPGFVPQWTLVDGITELYEDFKKFGLKKEHLFSDEFVTVSRYKSLLAQGKIDKDFRWKE